MTLITGTFLDGMACDVPSNNFTPEDWTKQFDEFRSLGMDTGIVIRAGWGNSSLYDSQVMRTTLFPEEDMLELFFREADRTEMKLFVGLYDSFCYWLKNDWDPEVELSSRLIDELLERYSHHRSFYGWYLCHEGDLRYHQEKIWNPLARKMRAITPDKLILVSPRYCGIKYDPSCVLTPDQHKRHFEYIFNEMNGLIDIAAFMDGHVDYKDLGIFAEVTAEVCAKYGIEFWSNLETFDRDMPWRFPPIEFTKLEYKLKAVQPYASKVITFEAPHFLSSLSMFPSARNLLRCYRKKHEQELNVLSR